VSRSGPGPSVLQFFGWSAAVRARAPAPPQTNLACQVVLRRLRRRPAISAAAGPSFERSGSVESRSSPSRGRRQPHARRSPIHCACSHSAGLSVPSARAQRCPERAEEVAQPSANPRRCRDRDDRPANSPAHRALRSGPLSPGLPRPSRASSRSLRPARRLRARACVQRTKLHEARGSAGSR